MYLLNGLGTGGAERSLTDLLPEFRVRGIEIVIVCLFKREFGVQSEVVDTTEVHFIGAASWPGRILSARRYLRRLHPNLLHTTLFESDVIGRLAAVGTGVPVLTSLVNTSYDAARLEVDRQLRKSRVLAARWLDGWTARHLVARFHAITAAVKEAAVTHLRIPSDRIRVIGRGRDLNRLGEGSPARRQQIRADLGMEATDEVLLAVGRHEFQKGHVFLLEALAKLREQRPRLRLLIAGREGNATSQIQQAIARLGLGPLVALLGHRSDIGDLLAASDVFCFPSIYEGFGGAAMEAMAVGTPIVASDLPALREVLGTSAVFAKPQSTEELAEAIDRVLDDPNLAKAISAAAKERVRNNYSLERIADQMADLYRDAITTGRIRKA
jgi:glycosyltransferase involved in cell wall biosynthesis